jgi:hypothetical protein
MRIAGSCHYGAIKYEADIDPAQVCICHCTGCQTLSGSAFRTVAGMGGRFGTAGRYTQLANCV